MRIGGLQKLTLLDYPGLMACIVFIQGCNFRCPFCHNKELVLPTTMDGGIGEEEIMDYLKKRQTILEGVVITGGEPLLWTDLRKLLEKIEGLGYKIKLDTNGSFPERLEALIEEGLVDYVALDIKQAPARYSTATGIPGNDVTILINRSLEYLRKSGTPFEIRTTLVKGIHRPEDMAEMAKWVGDAPYFIQSYVASEGVLAPKVFLLY